jgi:hypothetical protein
MARAADDAARSGIQRGRGGFMRSAADTPYVSDPSGATMKHDGTKADLIALCAERGIEVPDKVTVAQLQELLGPRPKRLAYGSPSNRGKQIENTTNLVKWGERRVVLGIGADPELVAMCAELVALDVDSDDYKTLADSIIIKAKEAAEVSLAADRGTLGHALSEDFDEGRDWLGRAESGELLGIPTDAQARLVQAWRDMLERSGLEILAVEASCVDDTWRLAGTLDRIARTTLPLRFALPGGEVREIPAGTVLVLDIKTGKKRTDNRSGAVLYWQGYAIQIASYAQAVPYDTEAEARGEWPWEIDQTHALIAHLDVLAAIDGDATCELVYVDLVAGREHGGETVVQAKAWESRIDVFSIAELDTDLSATPPVVAEPSTDVPATVEAPPEPIPVATPVVDRTPADEQHAVRSRPAPDEGDGVVDPTYEVLQRNYVALAPEARAWITALTEQATRGGVSFHSKGHRTQRRYEIIRALVHLAAQGIDDTIDDTVRTFLEVVIGDVAQFPSVPLGHLIGSLSAQEAATFAALADGTNLLAFTAEGKPTLHVAA